MKVIAVLIELLNSRALRTSTRACDADRRPLTSEDEQG